jgi:hypothetical protein
MIEQLERLATTIEIAIEKAKKGKIRNRLVNQLARLDQIITSRQVEIGCIEFASDSDLPD